MNEWLLRDEQRARNLGMKRLRKRKDHPDEVVEAVVSGAWQDIPGADAHALLAGVAAALNACDEAGLRVRLKHGIVFTRAGYVLPVGDGWAARTLAYTPFSQQGDGDGED